MKHEKRLVMVRELDIEYFPDKDSPFESGRPVSPDLFIGRKKTIEKIVRYAGKVVKGNVEHFFLTGDRRMGKTSVAEFVQNFLEVRYNMLGVYVSNKGNNSVEELTAMIIEAVFNKLPHDTGKDKIFSWFGRNVESIEIRGNKIHFRPTSILRGSFRSDFSTYLRDIYVEEFSDKYSGMLIIIDDINGLSDSDEFVDWYNKLADTIAFNREDIPLYFLLESYPEKFDKLVELEPSFGSIFHYNHIGKLSDSEVRQFFINTFGQQDILIEDDALDLMVDYSAGLPLMMQQIGDSTFWIDDNNITRTDALSGIRDAADEVGRKQMKGMLNQISEDYYRKILEILAGRNLSSFKKSDILKLDCNLSEDEVNSFIEDMLDAGIIDVSYDGYRFGNDLYYNYFLIISVMDKY